MFWTPGVTWVLNFMSTKSCLVWSSVVEIYAWSTIWYFFDISQPQQPPMCKHVNFWGWKKSLNIPSVKLFSNFCFKVFKDFLSLFCFKPSIKSKYLSIWGFVILYSLNFCFYPPFTVEAEWGQKSIKWLISHKFPLLRTTPS